MEMMDVFQVSRESFHQGHTAIELAVAIFVIIFTFFLICLYFSLIRSFLFLFRAFPWVRENVILSHTNAC